VEYTAPGKVPHYADCEPLVSGLGYRLVEFAAYKRAGTWHVKAVITSPSGVGIDDCSRVHRALLPRLEAVLATQDMHVEVASPGLDRVLKDASEFACFEGKEARVWDTEVSDWVRGTVVRSDESSVTLSVSGEERSFPYGRIAKAKLADRA